jgi:hypothetical protein
MINLKWKNSIEISQRPALDNDFILSWSLIKAQLWEVTPKLLDSRRRTTPYPAFLKPHIMDNWFLP